jgi:hypothetical protein
VDVERSVLLFCAIVAVMAFVCGTIGLRLVFDRPNRYQSLLPPFGWYTMGSVFVLLGSGLGFVVIRQGDYGQLVGAACAILVAFWCWKAGRTATARGRSDAHASPNKRIEFARGLSRRQAGNQHESLSCIRPHRRVVTRAVPPGIGRNGRPWPHTVFRRNAALEVTARVFATLNAEWRRSADANEPLPVWAAISIPCCRVLRFGVGNRSNGRPGNPRLRRRDQTLGRHSRVARLFRDSFLKRTLAVAVASGRSTSA